MQGSMRHNHLNTSIHKSCGISSQLPQPLNTQNEASSIAAFREDTRKLGKGNRPHDHFARYMRATCDLLVRERARRTTPQYPVDDR